MAEQQPEGPTAELLGNEAALPSSPVPIQEEAVIRTEGLTKIYPGSGDGDLIAVDHLELTVNRGEIFGLLGPNGAGKTTTVGMLTTRVVPTSGRAVVNGVDVVAEPARAKQFLGVVHQANTLDRSLTVEENLYFHGRYFGMDDGAARRSAGELLERFRLAGRAKSAVRTLSGGMAQRLMVARAIMHRPAVLFLDEPTAGLDPQSRLALWEIVGELHDEGQTVLLTTHYMEEADRFCDRVAIMDHGRVLALDTPHRLKQTTAAARGSTTSAQSWLRQSLQAMGVTSAEGDGDDARAAHGAAVEGVLAEILRAAEKLGIALEDLPIGDTTLEAVFIDLTGRDLRE